MKGVEYHALFELVVLGHLDEGLKESAMVLNENLTGLSIATLNRRGRRPLDQRNCVTADVSIQSISCTVRACVRACVRAMCIHRQLTCTHRSSGVTPFLSARYLAPLESRICAVSLCP